MYACICTALTERALREAISAGQLSTLEDVQAQTGASSCCGRCEEHVAFVLEQQSLHLSEPVATSQHGMRVAVA